MFCSQTSQKLNTAVQAARALHKKGKHLSMLACVMLPLVMIVKNSSHLTMTVVYSRHWTDAGHADVH